jgi:ankyrin repeat protein
MHTKRLFLGLIVMLELDACKPSPEDFIAAVKSGDATTVSKMLDRKADPNVYDEHGQFALSIAAEDGNLAIVQALLSHHANPNSEDAPGAGGGSVLAPIDQAAKAGKSNVIPALIAGGAKPEGHGGESPLARAVDTDDRVLMTTMLAANADVNGGAADWYGFPPIVIAADKKRIDVIRLLLSKGARIDQRDDLGMTALNTACANGDYETAKFLLDNGADALAMNRAGWTPAFTTAYHVGNEVTHPVDQPDFMKLFVDHRVTNFKMIAPPAVGPSGMGMVSVPVATAKTP